MKLFLGFMCTMLLFTALTYSCGEPIAVSDNFVEDLDSLFDVAYLPANSKDFFSPTEDIQRDGSVGVIMDALGDRDLIYAGLPEPKLTGRPPIYYEDAEGQYIYFDNEFATQYNSIQFPGIPQPYEVWMVWRQWQGPRGEAFNSHPRGFEWRDRETGIGMSAGVIADRFEPGTLMQPSYDKFIVKAQFNGNQSKCWINDVQVPGTLSLGDALLENINLGTNSNNAHADFFGMWVKFGLTSPGASDFIFNELSRKYDVATPPQLPYARDISLDFENDVWTANYTYVNAQGDPEDTGATEYRWYYGLRGSAASLPDQFLIEGATGKTLNRLDYPELFSNSNPFGWIKCQVRVHDTNGDFWRFNSSFFVWDNIY